MIRTASPGRWITVSRSDNLGMHFGGTRLCGVEIIDFKPE
jgi:hypothetical protein